MNYEDYFNDLIKGPVKLVATATNGLDPRKNSLLAVAVKTIAIDGTELGNKLYLRRLDKDTVMTAADYHKLSFETVSRIGLDEDEFRSALADELRDAVLFTYNPAFQAPFLEQCVQVQPMHDLPLLLKGAEMLLFLGHDEVSSIAELVKLYKNILGKPPSLKNMCKFRGISETPPFDVLPVVYSADILLELWKRLVQSQIQIQPQLPGIQ